ncbi:S1C family serine protease [Treponema endosymbiont of Eucomonympha sp.]|uniref:S1C family serine protease n=1 Tax=Treponema endosymbiont of Eucomonympha sp. TaxID=1580831 RepID=UPI000750F6C5|nr:trypsin-like peptidase domain-containing protein [Treponema endosymbiont of Eucomonympha sp.]
MKTGTRRVIFAAVAAALVSAAATANICRLAAQGNSPPSRRDTSAAGADSLAPPVADLPGGNIAGSADSPVSGGSARYAAAGTAGYTQDEAQNIFVYENCNEAVVNINTQVMAVNWFLEPVPQDGGSGSGSIIDGRGYVVTNTHVISDAYKITVSLADGTQREGKVVGTDSASDIAVLKFDPPAGAALRTIAFGDSSALKIGQKVLAIGNPFGFERTLTTGIVSGLGRPIRSSKNTIIRDMIQTDTAINPGNSGGPLLDAQGSMIGVNTMIYSTSGSSAGVGFAVPVGTARRVVSDLIQHGRVRRGVINASFVQLSPTLARYAGLDGEAGLLVSELPKNSPAAKAGLKAGTEEARYGSGRNARVIYLGGDVVSEIDGIRIASFADYYSVLESKRPGDTARVAVSRNGKRVTLAVPLEEQAED